MSEKMTPLSFRALLNWCCSEYEQFGTLFGVKKHFTKKNTCSLSLFGETLDTPFGPAAGPNTQLAENIIAAWFSGARFFELKTVQEMDGDQLASCINRPCIKADDEGYNCEWSTELYIPQAMAEYIKAWVLIKFLSSHYKLGNTNGFIFNISVGYNLSDIKKEKTDRFINGMMDASKTEAFQNAIAVLLEVFPNEKDFILSIPSDICKSVTVSTLHGCPPDEIEAIASYLLKEKKLHTFVKCNPTLLGYETARERLNQLRYDYVSFTDFHFNDDLQWKDAVPMFERLKALAESLNLEFGLKLSNTFPVDVKENELPSAEMYMSGKALYPLTIELASRISGQFGGKMRISYSGGADYFHISELFKAGIWPITMATTVLKPGGYNRFLQIADKLEAESCRSFTGTDSEKLAALSKEALSDSLIQKPVKPLPSRKISEQVPLLNCFRAPCMDGCPISQDIPAYMELCRKKEYPEALKVITEKNPLPFITGSICAHRCMNKCTRNFYESPVEIRDVKLLAAKEGYGSLIASIRVPEKDQSGKKAAIVGGGPTGIAASYFLSRSGIPVDVYEKEEEPGGIVRYVIPEFRISDEAIRNDISLARAYGANFICGKPAPSLSELKAMGYTHILYAIGAWKPGSLDIPGNISGVIEWMKAMKEGKAVCPKNIAVIGGGNTAMDAARVAAKAGASVSLVYRRSKKYMPADEAELQMAIKDGVQFYEQAAPIKQENGKLTLEKMELGAPDLSGRRKPIPTGEFFDIQADLVISAVGEKVEDSQFKDNGFELTTGIYTSLDGVYVAGDARRGPATIVEGIADARDFAEAVIGQKWDLSIPKDAEIERSYCYKSKGTLMLPQKNDSSRCLGCSSVCLNCVDVCPNRANVSIEMKDGSLQILHIDSLCNECGNCTSFCPYSSEPCKDKFTLFHSKDQFDNSSNAGFLVIDAGKVLVRLGSEVGEYDLSANNHGLYPPLAELIQSVLSDYSYLLNK